MRVVSLLILCLIAGCSKPGPVVAVDPLVGAWGDKQNVFQFFDNGTCVLLGKRFNASGSYSFSANKLLITNAKLQYHAPGFIVLRSSEFTLEAELGETLKISDSSSTILDKKQMLDLGKLTPYLAKELVGKISRAHRNAIRESNKPPLENPSM